jgi:succinyl-CoA synthetase beta subunit
LEALLVLALLAINPLVMTRRTRIGISATRCLLAAITIDNTASAAMLDYKHPDRTGQQ